MSEIGNKAELKRATTRAIFRDAMGLMDCTGGDAESGFHFYDGLSGLVRKLCRLPGQPLHQMWAAAEELRLLFDAHAVCLSVPIVDRLQPEPDSTGELVWEVATLTEDEKILLTDLRDGKVRLPLKKRREAGGMRWDTFQEPLSRISSISIKNSNLGSIDGVLIVDVPGGEGIGWQLTVWMEHESPGRATPRESRRFCEALLPEGGAEGPAQAFREALSRLKLPFGAAPELDSNDHEFWPVDRKHFQEECERLPNKPAGFCDLYRNRFRSIHTVLERAYQQMDEMLIGGKEGQDNEWNLIFSYRAPGEDFICFFPTIRQAEQLIESGVEVEDFLEYWQFPYKQSQAISGWVLATGTCDYTENFDADGRWKEWIDTCAENERPSVEKQLDRVRRFFKSGGGVEQKYMYLIPIVLRASVPNGKPGGGSRLQPVLMASLGSSKPLSNPSRRQLYDLAWQMVPTVEMALFGQTTLETVHRQEVQIQTVGRVSGSFAHEVGQPLQQLISSLESVRLLVQEESVPLDELRKLSKTDLELAFQAVRDIAGLRDTTLHIAKLAGGGKAQFASFSLDKRLSDTVEKFAGYCSAMKGDNIRVEMHQPCGVGKVCGDAAMIETMMQNLLRNSMEALAREDSGLIQVSAHLADDRVLIMVKDNGRGIEPGLIKKLNNGETYSTKPLGVGLGLMTTRLVCAAHAGTYLIKSEPDIGTLVTINLSVNASGDGANPDNRSRKIS